MANLANIPPPGWLTSPFLRGPIRKNSLLCVACKAISESFKVYLKPQNQSCPKRRIEQ